MTGSDDKITGQKKSAEEKKTESALFRALKRFNVLGTGEALSFSVNQHQPENECQRNSSERVKVKVAGGEGKPADPDVELNPIMGVKKALNLQDEAAGAAEAEEGGQDKEAGEEPPKEEGGDEKEAEAGEEKPAAADDQEANPADPLAKFRQKMGGGMLGIRKKHFTTKRVPPKDNEPQEEAKDGEQAEETPEGEAKPEPEAPESDQAQEGDKFSATLPKLPKIKKPQLQYVIRKSQRAGQNSATENLKKKAKVLAERIPRPQQLLADAGCPDVYEEAMLITEHRPLYQNRYFLAIPMVQFLATAALMAMMYNLPKSLALSLAATTTSLIVSLAMYESRRQVYSTKDSVAMVGMFASASTLMFTIYHMIKSPRCYDCIVAMNVVESVVTAMATFGFFSMMRPL